MDLELANATRPQLLERIAEICRNHQEPIDKNTWDSVDERTGLPNYTDEDLRTVLALVNQDYYTLFRRYSIRRYGKGICYLARNLYNYIRVYVLTYDPLTGVEHTDRQRKSIIDAMKMFARTPGEMQEILEAERFVNSTVVERRRMLGQIQYANSNSDYDSDSDPDSDSDGDEDGETRFEREQRIRQEQLVERILLMEQEVDDRLRQIQVPPRFPIPGPIRPPSSQDDLRHMIQFAEHYQAYLNRLSAVEVIRQYTVVKYRISFLQFDYRQPKASLTKGRLYLHLQLNMVETSMRVHPDRYQREYEEERWDEGDVLERYMERIAQPYENVDIMDRPNEDERDQKMAELSDQLTLMFQRPFSEEESLLWWEIWIRMVIQLELWNNIYNTREEFLWHALLNVFFG